MRWPWPGEASAAPSRPAWPSSLRKATYTYGNIVTRKAFTVSIPSEEHVRQADYFGIAAAQKSTSSNEPA